MEKKQEYNNAEIDMAAVDTARSTMSYPAAREPYTSAYDMAEKAAMSAIHKRRLGLVMSLGTDVLLENTCKNPVATDIMLHVLRPHILRAIRRTSDPVVSEYFTEKTDLNNACRTAALACARYLDAIVRTETTWLAEMEREG